jgi:hypothetical protein
LFTIHDDSPKNKMVLPIKAMSVTGWINAKKNRALRRLPTLRVVRAMFLHGGNQRSGPATVRVEADLPSALWKRTSHGWWQARS